MEIRDATEADLPAIVAIYNESIPGGTSTADLKPITVEERQGWFSRFDPTRRPIWVAVDEDGTIMGCVYLTSFYEGRPAYDKTAEISTYLSRKAQGRGLGTLLKEKMIAACPGFGVENLLSLYFDHNEATKRVNEKLGFVPVGHLPEIADVFGTKRGLMIGLLKLGRT
ncbi:MAG: GNAT family N-acetyltransferase [Akkermansiaceae bacterium]